MQDDIGENQSLLPTGHASTGGVPLTHSQGNAWRARRNLFSRPLLPLLLAVVLFALSMGAGRYASLRKGRPPAPAGDGPPAPASLSTYHGLDVDIPTSVDYPEVESRTELCATPTRSMLGGVDVVAYRDLEEGATPIYGVPEHTLVYNGYTLLFLDKTNKARFLVSKLP